MKDLYLTCLSKIFMPVCAILGSYLKFNKICIVSRYGKAIGDHVAMTTIISKLRHEHHLKVVVFSNQADVFFNHPDIWKFSRLNFIPNLLRRFAFTIFKMNRMNNFYEFRTPLQKGETFQSKMREDKIYKYLHITQANSHHFEHKFTWQSKKGTIVLTNFEKENFEAKFHSILSKKYALVHSQGKAEFTKLKEWGVEKFQTLINSMSDQIIWVQVGSTKEELLQNTIDLRGSTNLRELAFLISRANFVVCQEGLYTHMAGALETPCFTIFSGFLLPDFSSYDSTIPIFQKNMPCAPCWKADNCNNDYKCMNSLTPQMVSEKIHNHLQEQKSTSDQV